MEQQKEINNMKCQLPKKIFYVSKNENKIKESKAILKIANIEYIAMEIPELQGNEDYIVQEKCLAAFHRLGEPVIVEDTSLRFDALNGLPGPYIKWFLEKLGVDELPKLLYGFENKSATAVSIIGYCENAHGPVELYHGETKGIVVPPRGTQNFGWDPIFCVEGVDKTFAEMSPSEKNELSHRQKALVKLERSFHKKYI